MKIINRQDFLKMPAGTIFSNYEPCIFGPLSIKGDSLGHGNDFWVQGIADAVDASDLEELHSALERARQTEESVALDLYCEGRDAMYNDKQLFAVWEHEDVVALIKRLTTAMSEASK